MTAYVSGLYAAAAFGITLAAWCLAAAAWQASYIIAKRRSVRRGLAIVSRKR